MKRKIENLELITKKKRIKITEIMIKFSSDDEREIDELLLERQFPPNQEEYYQKQKEQEQESSIKRDIKSIFEKGFTPNQKGDWLEDRIKTELTKAKAVCTVTKARSTVVNPITKEMIRDKIIGDNGYDGKGRIRINNRQIHFAIQAKMYNKHNKISAGIIRDFYASLTSEHPGCIGLLVTPYDNLEERARIFMENSNVTILHITLEKLKDLKKILLEQELRFGFIEHSEKMIKNAKGYKKFNKKGEIIEQIDSAELITESQKRYQPY